MLNEDKIALCLLLQAGYTHNELKDILFYTSEKKESLRLWNETVKGNIEDTIGDERKKKIQTKLIGVKEEEIMRFLQEKEVDIIDLSDERYPEKLKSIRHAPAFFFLRGTWKQPTHMLGVVGSRKNTHYAERILQKILPDLIHANMGIISGGATGVDTLAHEISLGQGGYTLAVFGNGIDRCYPSGNRKLFESIIHSGGGVISHFPLGMSPEVYNFPIRNELVAAISDGILIPEAGLSSGTLITAQLALEHGRDVFAVPGDIDRVTSEGTNMLISSGQAKCVRCAGDILEEYFDISSIGSGMTPIVRTVPVFSNDVEKVIYTAIEGGSDTVDNLLQSTGKEMTEILTTIAMLEILGYVMLDEMGRYRVT